jgi:hypothetical protein
VRDKQGERVKGRERGSEGGEGRGGIGERGKGRERREREECLLILGEQFVYAG